MPNVIKHRRIVSSKDPDVLTLVNDVNIIKNNEIKITYFEPINSSTGTINLPTGATILLDQFEKGADAFVSKIFNNKPTGEFPIDDNGNKVDVSTFDALGNYTLTSEPNLYPVALIYIFKIKLIDYSNVDLNYIIEEDEINSNEILLKQHTAYIKASENISAGDFINIWNDSGTSKIRRALADSTGMLADGFVLENVLNGDLGLVYFKGKNTELSGIIPGTIYYLSDINPGKITNIPISTSNHYIQKIGKGFSSTELIVEELSGTIIKKA